MQNLKNNENFLNNDLMEASISSSSSSSFSDDVLRKNVQEEIVRHSFYLIKAIYFYLYKCCLNKM